LPSIIFSFPFNAPAPTHIYTPSLHDALPIFIQQLKQRNIQIPQDLSVVGEDNSVLSKLSEMELTTTAHPQELLGSKAAEWMVNAIDTDKEEDSQLIDTYIIERNSVKKI